MEKNRVVEILNKLASGCSPQTGEVLTAESVLNELEVIRALQGAITELMKDSGKVPRKKKKEDEAFREIDYFRREKFNTLTQSVIDQINERIESFGMLRFENLPESINKARVVYQRAYEPWSVAEKELLNEAMKYTNDLEVLSECFQRGKGSIETTGQKIIYDSQA